MKKYKQLLLALIITLVFFVIFLSCNGEPFSPEKSLVGFVTVVGNEPFTHLALKTDDGEIYVLDCYKLAEEELWKMQGTRITIYYKVMKEIDGFRTVKVIRYAVWK